MKDFWYIGGIGIEKGAYPAEQVEPALERIKAFCAKTTIKMESYGHGYGVMKIKIGNNAEKKYDYSPYGIDIKMMLKFIEECEPLIAAANQTSQTSQANNDNRYSQFHHPSSPTNNQGPRNNEGQESQWSFTSCILH